MQKCVKVNVLVVRFVNCSGKFLSTSAAHADDEAVLAVSRWRSRSLLGAKQRSRFSHCISSYSPNKRLPCARFHARITAPRLQCSGYELTV